MDDLTLNEGSAEDPQGQHVWLIHNAAREEWMTQSGTWRPKKFAGTWDTEEAAKRAMRYVGNDQFSSVQLVQEIRLVVSSIAASDLMSPPRRHGMVPSSWIAATGTMSAHALLKVLREVEDRGVDPKDLDAVKAIHEELTVGVLARYR